MLFDYIKDYATIWSPSGEEGRVTEKLKENLGPYSDSMKTDGMGNLYVYREGGLPGTLGLSAHQDKVVNPLLDVDLFKTGRSVYDAKVFWSNHDLKSLDELVGQKGLIKTRVGLYGVKISKVDNMRSRLKLKSGEDLPNWGLVLATPTFYDDEHSIYGKLDDSAGLGLITDIFQNVPREQSPNLMGVFTVEEERGLEGAYHAINNEWERLEDISEMIVVDTTPMIEPGGGFAIYAGCCRGVGEVVDLEKDLVRKIERKIGGRNFRGNIIPAGSNDSLYFSQVIPTVALEPPILEMHSANEMIAKDDLLELQRFLHQYTQTFQPLE